MHTRQNCLHVSELHEFFSLAYFSLISLLGGSESRTNLKNTNTLLDTLEEVQFKLDDDKVEKYHCVYFDDDWYWGKGKNLHSSTSTKVFP